MFPIDAPRLIRIYSDPIALGGLAVAMLPLFGLIFLGWGPGEIVMMYWIENLVIGVGTLARLIVLGATPGKREAIFLVPFFAIHYGMFCGVHGVFLMDFFDGDLAPLIAFTPVLLAWEAVLFVTAFLLPGLRHETAPGEVMFEPYGRVVVIHLGIFAAAFGGTALGAPMAGALGVILLRVLWDVFLTIRRRRKTAES